MLPKLIDTNVFLCHFQERRITKMEQAASKEEQEQAQREKEQDDAHDELDEDVVVTHM